MNENVYNSYSLLNNICRCCLNMNVDLKTLSNDQVMLYQNFVNKVFKREYAMRLCIYCYWMFKRVEKFKKQCQLANETLAEAFLKQNLSQIQNLTISHDYQTKTGQIHIISQKSNINDHSKSLISDKSYQSNDYDKKSRRKNYFKKKSCPTSDYNEKTTQLSDDTENSQLFESDCREISDIDEKSQENRDFYEKSQENHDYYEKSQENRDYDRKSHIGNDFNDSNVVKEEFNDCEDIFVTDLGDDDDESLQDMIKREKKKKPKRKCSTSKSEDGKSETKNTKFKCKRDKKDLPAGFSSRMVQETDEYIVIKLTKEQVLQDMLERSKSELYQRAPYKCDKCVKGFNFEDVLTNHMDKHSLDNGSFVCDMCFQRCPSAVSLRGHIKSHTTRYKCKLCDQVKLSRQHLLEHYSITHSGQAVKYKCDSCDFTTDKRTVMQRHVRCHSASERHACHQCGKLFKTRDSLRVHTVRHDKSAKIQCSLCDNSFIYQSLLQKHMTRVHQRNDYYCVECDVKFKCSESLKLHFKKAKVHRDTSNKSNNSSINNMDCDKCVSNTCDIHTHMKRFKCPQCAASYTRKSSLKQHLRTHEVETHVCHCGTNFNDIYELNRHLQETHGDYKQNEDILQEKITPI